MYPLLVKKILEMYSFLYNYSYSIDRIGNVTFFQKIQKIVTPNVKNLAKDKKQNILSIENDN